MQWLNVILQGVLIGGLYAMFAAGLSLIFGVMRLVNIAHGDLIVLAAYVALLVTQALGIDPLVSLLLVVPITPWRWSRRRPPSSMPRRARSPPWARASSPAASAWT